MIKKVYRHSIERINSKIQKLILNLYDTSPIEQIPISTAALDVAKTIRGLDRPPAIILHGVLPRSGTVYAGELIRLHPDIHAYPNDLWEVPFLKCNDELLMFNNSFFKAFKKNRYKMGRNDLQCLFGASFIAYLYSFIPKGKRLFLKTPWAESLESFFTVFPSESLISLLRDGRDVVHSTVKTWKGKHFSSVCIEWEKNAKSMLYCNEKYTNLDEKYFMYKYESLISDPQQFIKIFCEELNLDIKKYPFQEIEKLPVRGSSSQKTNGKVTWKPKDKTLKFESTHHWKTWSKRKKRIFKRHAGDTLIKCGYSYNSEW